MAKIDRTDLAQLERWHETLARARYEDSILLAPDGMSALKLPHLTGVVLRDRGLWTIAQIQRRVADDTIGDVPRIGRGREKEICEALARWGRSRSDALGYRDDG